MAEEAEAGRMVEIQGKRYWLKEPDLIFDEPMVLDPPESMETMWRRYWIQRWAEESLQRLLAERPPITMITDC